jgi:hypothetical protein
MAKTPVNSGLEQVRGRIGGWVYRLLEGETIIATRPRRATEDRPSDEQKAVRERFRRAATYARSIYADPVRKAAYLELAARRGVPASRLFGFIVGDYARPPEVTTLDVTDYRRAGGGAVRVYATDDGEVELVSVAVKAADGTVLEEGDAVAVDAFWRFSNAVAVPAGAPVTVEATAIDRAGNRTVKSVVIP